MKFHNSKETMQGIYRILYNNAVNAKLTIITKDMNNKSKQNPQTMVWYFHKWEVQLKPFISLLISWKHNPNPLIIYINRNIVPQQI